MSTQARPSIVFAHGLWADGSCFSKLIPTLQAEGHEVIASQYGLDSLAGDVAAVRHTWPGSAARRSSSGTPMAARSSHPPGPIPALPGSSTSRRWRRTPTKHRRACRTSSDDRSVLAHRGRGRAHLAETGRRRVLRRRPARGGAEARVGDARRAGRGPVHQKVEGTAWRSKPSWYIVATQDRTVHPELERFVAKRMGATTIETDSSHVPMLSSPALVLDVIRKAANAVQTATISG